MLEILERNYHNRLETYMERCAAASRAGAFATRMPKQKTKPFQGRPRLTAVQALSSKKHSVSLPSLSSVSSFGGNSIPNHMGTTSIGSSATTPAFSIANITGNASAENVQNNSFDPGGSAILPPIGGSTANPISIGSNNSLTESGGFGSSASLAGSRYLNVSTNSSRHSCGINNLSCSFKKDLPSSGGSVNFWATSAVNAFYSSQKSAYVDFNLIGDSASDSIFEMDSMTASLLRRQGNRKKKYKRSGRKDTMRATIDSTDALGVTAAFLRADKGLDVENIMKLSGHTRVRKSKLNMIGKTTRRKATDVGGRGGDSTSARSVALDRALNTCLEAHFEVERAKFH